MSFGLSIDPGTNATGLCVWVDGWPVRLVTIRTVTKNDRLCYETKRQLLHENLVVQIDKLIEEFGPLQRVAIEDFIPRTVGAKVNNIQKLYKTVGTIEALLWERYKVQPKRICKGRAPKEEARWLAVYYKLMGPGSTLDSRDALHVGCLAGFAREQR